MQPDTPDPIRAVEPWLGFYDQGVGRELCRRGVTEGRMIPPRTRAISIDFQDARHEYCYSGPELDVTLDGLGWHDTTYTMRCRATDYAGWYHLEHEVEIPAGPGASGSFTITVRDGPDGVPASETYTTLT